MRNLTQKEIETRAKFNNAGLEKPDLKYKDSVIAAHKASFWEHPKYNAENLANDDVFNDFIKDNNSGYSEGSGRYHNLWLNDNDKFIGRIRFKYLRYKTQDNIWQQDIKKRIAGHIGYRISPEYYNKGYGTLLLSLGLDYLLNEYGITEIRFCVDKTNIASNKIAQNCGGIATTSFNDEKGNTYFEYFFRLK